MLKSSSSLPRRSGIEASLPFRVAHPHPGHHGAPRDRRVGVGRPAQQMDPRHLPPDRDIPRAFRILDRLVEEALSGKLNDAPGVEGHPVVGKYSGGKQGQTVVRQLDVVQEPALPQHRVVVRRKVHLIRAGPGVPLRKIGRPGRRKYDGDRCRLPWDGGRCASVPNADRGMVSPSCDSAGLNSAKSQTSTDSRAVPTANQRPPALNSMHVHPEARGEVNVRMFVQRTTSRTAIRLRSSATAR